MRVFEGYQRGINLGGWLSQCDHQKRTYDSLIIEDDIKRIASWGLDHVRLPIDYELVQDDSGEFREEGFIYLDRCIDWCKRQGINLILDLHKTAGYSFDEQDTASRFFQSQELQQRFVDLWEEFAKRYGDSDNSVAFELLNEIVSVNVAEEWNKLIARTVRVIRNYTKDTKIIIGGVHYNGVTAIKFLEPPADKNIVYNFHCHEPLIFTHQAAYWVEGMPSDYKMVYPSPLKVMKTETEKILDDTRTQIYDVSCLTEMGPDFFEKIFFEAEAMSQLRDVPLYCGEYGVIDKAPLDSTLKWFKDIHAVFEKKHIGRAAWNYKGKDFGIMDAHYDPIREELIKYL